MKLTKHLLIPAAIFAATSASNAANIITNGDFELGVTAYQNYNAGSEFGRTNYGVDFGNTVFFDNWARGGGATRGWTAGTGGVSPATFPASLGGYFLRIDANDAGNPGGNPDYIVQTGFTLTAGLTYNFSADLFGQTATGAQVILEFIGTGGNVGNNVSVGTFTDTTDVAGGSITAIASDFSSAVTTTGTYELRISSPSNGDNHSYIDNIVVDEVPEPSTTALLGLGGLALILRRRK